MWSNGVSQPLDAGAAVKRMRSSAIMNPASGSDFFPFTIERDVGSGFVSPLPHNAPSAG